MLRSKTKTGQLDRRIKIQQAATSKDDYNQDEIISWNDFATVWASLEDSQGSEGLQADQITAVRTTNFVIRYLDGVTEKMRVLFDGRHYDIQSIQRPDRKRSLILKTTILDDETDAEVGEGIFDLTFDDSFE
jgi:SPP1 family predicted phage head-tail adaptor